MQLITASNRLKGFCEKTVLSFCGATARALALLFIVVGVFAVYGTQTANAASLNYNFDTPTTGSGLEPYLVCPNVGISNCGGTISTVISQSSPNSIGFSSPTGLYTLNGRVASFGGSTSVGAMNWSFYASSTAGIPSIFQGIGFGPTLGLTTNSSSTKSQYIGIGRQGTLYVLDSSLEDFVGPNMITKRAANLVASYPNVVNFGQWNTVYWYWSGTTQSLYINDVEIPMPTLDISPSHAYISNAHGDPSGSQYPGWYQDDLLVFTEGDAISPGSSQPLNNTYNTKLISADIDLSTSTGALLLDVDYFIDTADFFNANDRPDTVIAYISSFNASQIEQKQRLILPLSDGNASVSFGTSFTEYLSDGNYSINIRFFNIATQRPVFGRTYLTYNIFIDGGLLVSSNLVDESNGVFPPQPQQLEDCGITEIGGCITNSFRLLFIPSQESLISFSNVTNILQTKLPFVYAYQASSMMSEMYSGSATSSIPTLSYTTGIGTITFISESQLAAIPYVSLLRSLIAYGLWIMLFVALYRKTLTIHDQKTV